MRFLGEKKKNLPMNLPDIGSWPGPQAIVSKPRKK